MLSKKIDFNFSSLFKKNRSDIPKESTAKNKRLTATHTVDSKTKVAGFAIGFFITIALGALIISIGLILF